MAFKKSKAKAGSGTTPGQRLTKSGDRAAASSNGNERSAAPRRQAATAPSGKVRIYSEVTQFKGFPILHLATQPEHLEDPTLRKRALNIGVAKAEWIDHPDAIKARKKFLAEYGK